MNYNNINKYRMKENNKTTGYIRTDEVRAQNIENQFDELELQEVEE